MQTFMIFTFIMLSSSIHLSHAKTQSTVPAQNFIESISIEHTNPSLGPQETIRTITLVNNANHKEQFAAFLAKAQIFDMSFAHFIQAHVEKDTKVLEQIKKKSSEVDGSLFSSGGIVSSLSIHMKDRPPIVLNDLRYYKLNKDYQTFVEYLAKHGNQTEAHSESHRVQKPLSAEILNED